MTSVRQPMHMGVIKNVKGHYQSSLSTHVVAALDCDSTVRASEVIKKFNLLDDAFDC